MIEVNTWIDYHLQTAMDVAEAKQRTEAKKQLYENAFSAREMKVDLVGGEGNDKSNFSTRVRPRVMI